MNSIILYYKWCDYQAILSVTRGFQKPQKPHQNRPCTHINNITNKALSTKAFLQRNLRSCTSHTKLQCYTTMIRPILEYANTVWSPYTKKDIAKIERVQRQSACFIMADYSHHSSVTNMLTNLKVTVAQLSQSTEELFPA